MVEGARLVKKKLEMWYVEKKKTQVFDVYQALHNFRKFYVLRREN